MKLRFSIAEERNPLRTRSVMDLCDYLTEKMLVPRFAASGSKWSHEFMDFFTFDNTCDPLQPTGTIIFTVPPLFAGCAASLQASILDELGKLKIKTGAIVQEEHPVVPAAQVMRIQIVDNPTALLQPPEVNMSVTRGTVVLRDLLGYQRLRRSGHDPMLEQPSVRNVMVPDGTPLASWGDLSAAGSAGTSSAAVPLVESGGLLVIDAANVLRLHEAHRHGTDQRVPRRFLRCSGRMPRGQHARARRPGINGAERDVPDSQHFSPDLTN